MASTIWIIHGPNLNRLGKREPDIYGSATLADVETFARKVAEEHGLLTHCFQSNHEGALIEALHQAGDENAKGIVINPGAYSHTSIALADAVSSIAVPVVEVHISNLHKREAFRHHSYISARAQGVIAGLGMEGYRAAIACLAQLDSAK